MAGGQYRAGHLNPEGSARDVLRDDFVPDSVKFPAKPMNRPQTIACNARLRGHPGDR
jgi:hypothetical protein